MVTEFNSAHKHQESPPIHGGRESETISDTLGIAGVMTCGIKAIG